MLYTKDGGVNWEREGSDVEPNLYCIIYNENVLTAIGAKGTIIKRNMVIP